MGTCLSYLDHLPFAYSDLIRIAFQIELQSLIARAWSIKNGLEEENYIFKSNIRIGLLS